MVVDRQLRTFQTKLFSKDTKSSKKMRNSEKGYIVMLINFSLLTISLAGGTFKD